MHVGLGPLFILLLTQNVPAADGVDVIVHVMHERVALVLESVHERPPQIVVSWAQPVRWPWASKPKYW